MDFEKGYVEISFDGSLIHCSGNLTVGAALYKSGKKILGRSVKYRRPRGLFCMTGACERCLVEIDGVPNLRACMVPVSTGMKARHQKGWPSVESDLFSAILSKTNFESGFYYKQGNLQWQLWKQIFKKFTGTGELPSAASKNNYTFKKIETDIVIVGSGLAGLSSAREIAKRNLNFILLEQMPWFGGRIALTNNSNFEPLDSTLVGGTSEELIAQLLPDTNKNLLLNTEAFGFYDSQTLMALSNRQTMIQFKAKAFIVACGTYGSNIRVPNSDLPGIFTAEGALILLNKYGVSLGKHGVIIEAGNNADFISKEFDALDLSYERVAQNEILSIDGSSVVRGVSVNRNGIRKFIKADFVVLAHKSTPAYDLAVQNGAAVSYDTNSKQFIVSHDENQKSSNGMFVAGQITGASDFKEIHLQGKLAGNSAVEHIKENQSTLEA